MSNDIEKPDTKPEWALSDVTDAQTGELNVLEPPDSKKNVGWNAFEAPARQFFNWLGRLTFKWILFLEDRIANRHIVDYGSITVGKENVLVKLYAISVQDPDRYIHAIGYRADGAVFLNVLDNNVLTIGTTDSTGLVEIDGAASEDIVIYVIMQK